MRLHPSFAATARKFRLQISEGRRSADRRIVQPSAPHSQALPSESAPGAVARHTDKRYRLPALRARSPLGAPPRRSPGFEAWLSPGPALAWDRDSVSCPSPRAASSSRAGRSAGRAGSQGRPGRFAKPRAGTALAPLSGSHLESALHRARLNSLYHMHDNCQVLSPLKGLTLDTAALFAPAFLQARRRGVVIFANQDRRRRGGSKTRPL